MTKKISVVIGVIFLIFAGVLGMQYFQSATSALAQTTRSFVAQSCVVENGYCDIPGPPFCCRGFTCGHNGPGPTRCVPAGSSAFSSAATSNGTYYCCQGTAATGRFCNGTAGCPYTGVYGTYTTQGLCLAACPTTRSSSSSSVSSDNQLLTCCVKGGFSYCTTGLQCDPEYKPSGHTRQSLNVCEATCAKIARSSSSSSVKTQYCCATDPTRSETAFCTDVGCFPWHQLGKYQSPDACNAACGKAPTSSRVSQLEINPCSIIGQEDPLSGIPLLDMELEDLAKIRMPPKDFLDAVERKSPSIFKPSVRWLRWW